jgi:hypothetical protein
MAHDHDVWYLACETTIDGERRGFSLSTRARAQYASGDVPDVVDDRAREFLSDVLDMSDVHVYDAVTHGDRCDWPYRYASYRLYRNGERVVSSFAVRPVKPEVAS